MIPKHKTFYIFITVLIVGFLGIFLLSKTENDTATLSALNDRGTLNQEFFKFDDNELTSPILNQDVREKGVYITFGAETKIDSDLNTAMDYYTNLLIDDGWVIDSTQAASNGIRIEADKKNNEGTYNYSLIINGSTQQDGTALNFNLRTAVLD